MSRLPVGETIVHYRIRSVLGTGGMGEVYLAEDERLRRPVALKVLHESSESFLIEARAASALNHPNVAHIYDVGRWQELVFIAMEYVEGVTLETRIARGALPVAEAVELAMQLADALCEAHAKDIVHRDLKPGNIVINRRGQAKILDFGIATLPGMAAVASPRTVAGTLPYMSPEQARGEGLDSRSDLFSFGVILYEMVAGRLPFEGLSTLDTMLRIIETEPPPLDDAVPAALRRIIARCLEKDRTRRYATPRELVDDLRELRAPAPPSRIRRIGIAVGLALLGVVLAAVFLRRDERPPAKPPRLEKLTTAPGLEDEPAISPDGRTIAFTSDEHGSLDLYVRPLAGGESVRLTDSGADDAQPAWSPDGKRIAFVSARDRGGRLTIVLGQALGSFVNAQGGDLFIVPAAGGAARKVIDNAFYPAWSPDGRWIVFQSARGGRWDLWKVGAAGGVPVQLTRDSEFDYQPSWSRDGKSIVYASGMPSPYRVKIIPADGGAAQVITDGKDQVLLKPVFSADGESVLYTSRRGGSLNLWRTWLTSKGAPERLTLGEGDDVNPSAGADGKRVVYASVRQTPDLWSLEVATGKLEQLTFETGIEEFPHRSSNGLLAFASDRGGKDAIWLRGPSGKLEMLVARAAAGQLRWSPDGKRIVYRLSDGGVTSIGIQEVGSTAPRIVAREAESPAWSPDGTRLAYTSWAKQNKAQIMVAPLDGSEPARFVTALPLTTSYPTWSPDGAFVAFQATRDDGARHIWIVELATGKARPLTTGTSEDSHPQWDPRDRDRILFVRNHENLMSVSVARGTIEPLTRFTEPNTILDYPGWSADGSRIDFSIARKRGDLSMLVFP